MGDVKVPTDEEMVVQLTDRLEQVLIRERCKDERITELLGIITKLQKEASPIMSLSPTTDDLDLKVQLAAGILANGKSSITELMRETGGKWIADRVDTIFKALKGEN